MKKWLFAVCLALIVTGVFPAIAAAGLEDFVREVAALNNDETHSGKRLIVKSSLPTIETFGAIKTVEGYNDLHVLQYATADEAEEALLHLRSMPHVSYVQPDLPVSISEEVKSWGESRIGAVQFNELLASIPDFHLPEVVVAVVDTGADYQHEFLQGRLIAVDKNFIGSNDSSQDDHGHGTHICGTIAGITGDNVKIKPIKVLNEYGSGTDLSVYNGVMYAIQEGADVINMSFAGYGRSALQEEAIAAAYAANIPVVVAAGNSGDDITRYTPARITKAIAVAAVDEKDQRTDWSNYGEGLDLSAPGVNIFSSALDNSYMSRDGTSSASAYVAGAAALLKTFDKSLSPAKIAAILKNTADDAGDPGWDIYYGAGIVNLENIISVAYKQQSIGG